MDRYISELAAGLQPYIPGKQPRDVQNLIKINTNENPYPPSPDVLDAITKAANADLRLYPDPASMNLRKAIAEYEGCGLGVDNVFVGNGSDEVLAFCFPAFFTGKAPVLFADVTYSFYKVYCSLFSVQYREIPLLDDFSVDLPAFCNSEAGGILIPNPNAPTGVALGIDDIDSILITAQCAVVIDEAYVDFGAQSCVELLSKHENLLIVRTLSKSHALAGMRLGYCIGQPRLIEALIRVKDSFNSYPIDRIAGAAGIAAMQSGEYYKRINQRICNTRDVFIRELNALGFKTLPSKANFVFTSPPDGNAAGIYNTLLKNGIIVRHFSGARTNNWLRISIGTPDEMWQTISVLKNIINPQM